MAPNMQEYVGLDIHKNFVFAVKLDSKGDIISEKKIRNDPYELDKFFKGINKDSNIALESCSCWEYVYDYLTDKGFTNVVLANPSRVSLIATSRKKTQSSQSSLHKSQKLKTQKLQSKLLAKTAPEQTTNESQHNYDVLFTTPR